MAVTVDTKGLSCPQPVLETLNALKSGSDPELVILVDTETARENVTRAVEAQGSTVKEVQSDGDGYKISVTKKRL